MARLDFPDYLRHLETESARLRAVLSSCPPDLPVPGCPDWTAADLVGHHGGVLDFWATIVEQRPAGPEIGQERSRPTGYDDLLAYHAAQQDRLVAALGSADPSERAWTWSSEQTVGFTFRRQAHEALIHRLDAEQTAGGGETPLDPALAADGVDEMLAVMSGGGAVWGSFAGSGRFVRVECTDTGDVVWAELGRFSGTDPESGTVYTDEDDLAAVVDPGRDADAAVAGTAGDLDAWLWHRNTDPTLTVSGDPATWEDFRRLVDESGG